MGVSTYSKVIGSLTGPYYKSITGQKQEPITDLALPCKTIVKLGTFEKNQYPVGTFQPPANRVWQQGAAPIGYWSTAGTRAGPRALAYNKARSRFLDKIGVARAQGLTAIAERASTVTMLNHRLRQLLEAASALRRGNFPRFLGALNVQPLDHHRNKRWNRPKELGGLWLEYWFGWAPTIGDIYSLVDAYTNEINDDRVKAGGVANVLWTDKGGDSNYEAKTSEDYFCTCHIGARVKVTNNDLLDLNEAGLLNPAQTALELIPFSWLAGWFMNLSDVLGSLTDTVGLKFENGWVAEKTQCRIIHTCVKKSNKVPYGFRDYWNLEFQRRLFSELPAPTFEWKLPNGLSVTRGATLAALVFQLFAPTGTKQPFNPKRLRI